MTTTPQLPASSPADTPPPEQVVPSIALDALLRHRDAAVAQLATIAKAVQEYQRVGETLWAGTNDGDGPWSGAPYKYREPIEQRPSGHGAHLDDDKWLEVSTKAVDAALWDNLLDQSGLRTFMDAKARKEWTEQIERRETPALTQENVVATFRHLHSMRGELFERGVVQVFRHLSWDYKTNLPHRFGKRIIIRGVVTADGRPGSYSYSDKLDDLDRAFHVLGGTPEPDHRSSIQSRLWHREPRHAPLETPYLRLATFKNGNGHITFLRPDLVDRLNTILAKHHPNALPPAVE